MTKIDRVVRSTYRGIADADAEDLAAEATCIQLERYGTCINDQAWCHCTRLVQEAARNIGYIPRTTFVGRYKSDKVKVCFDSLDSMISEDGFDVADQVDPRPEHMLQPVLDMMPEGPLKEVCCSLIDDDVESIEAAARQFNIDPKSVFTALSRIGKVLKKAEAMPDDTFFGAGSMDGVRRAISRICDVTIRRSQLTTSWDQQHLFA